jgi:hypothetical protein
MVCGQRHARPFYRLERPGIYFVGGWVGPRTCLDWWGKSRPPPGFDPQTVQPVVSRYTDYAIPAHKLFGGKYMLKYKIQITFFVLNLTE